MQKFGEWTPDIPPLENKGLTKAENVLPGAASYLPLPAATAYTTAQLAERAQGGISARDPSAVGTVYTYVGTETKLYSLTDTTWSDVSGTTYSTAADDQWDFTQWGNQVVGTNFADNIQVITLGGAAFGDLGGSPPKARYVDVVEQFLVVANTWDAVDGYQPQRVRWSGIGDITSWTVSATTQADYQNLNNNGGYIQGIVGGDYGLIFQERAITRMSYVGSPLVFQFDEVERERGALASGSIIKIGQNVAYLSADGFFVFDGQQSIPIGNKKVDDTFFNDPNDVLSYDPAYITRMTSSVYPSDQIIVWSYTSINAVGGTPDVLLFFNYSPNAETRWSYALVDNHLLLAPLSQGYTLDGLDAVSTSIDALAFSLDSRVWNGGEELLGIINDDLDLATFNGDPLDATIETGEFQLNPPGRTQVTMVRPFVDVYTGTVTVQLAERNLSSENAVFQGALTPNSAGFCNTRSNARFHRARINITGSFDHAEGFEFVKATPIGLR